MSTEKAATPVLCSTCKGYCPWDDPDDNKQIIGGTLCMHSCRTCGGTGRDNTDSPVTS